MSAPTLTPKIDVISRNTTIPLTDMFSFDPGGPYTAFGLPATLGGAWLGWGDVDDVSFLTDGKEWDLIGVIPTDHGFTFKSVYVTIVGEVQAGGGSVTSVSWTDVSLIVYDDFVGTHLHFFPHYPTYFAEVSGGAGMRYGFEAGGTFVVLSDLFTVSADTVDFNSLAADQEMALEYDAPRYDALDGNDVVTLPDKVAVIPGGWDENTFFEGGEGNDIIAGGDRNDKIDGGPGTDTIVFKAAKLNNVDAFNKSKLDVVNKDKDSEVVVETTLGKRDTIKDAEVAEFAGVKHPLAKFYFDIMRNADGTANLTVYENGTPYKTLKIKYDTLTPIEAEEYAAYFRTNNLQRIELEDWKGDAAVIKQSLVQEKPSAEEIDRTFIQIHPETANGQSEGCFLVGYKKDFMAPFYEHVANSIGGGFEGLFSAKTGGNYYYPVVPITVNVKGAAPQPKVVFGKHKVAQDDETKVEKVKFDVTGDPHPIKGKFVDVFFTVDGNAKLGVDWTFPDLKSSKPTPTQSQKHDWLWHEGNNIYGVRIGAENGVMKSDAAVRVKILGDKAGSKPEAAEFIKFEIADFALHTKSASKGWKEYSVSMDDKNDTDSQAYGAEKLLFGGANTRDFVLKIEADPVTAMGGPGSDVLVGGAGEDLLAGRGGDDVLRGRGGDDVLKGGSGEDILNGGAANDKLIGGGNDDLLRGGGGEDILNGGGGHDKLLGGGKDDVLRGRTGDDMLAGGRGTDTLQGGDGADRFVFTPGDGADRIVDFADGVDALDLTGFDMSGVQEAKSFASNVGDNVVFDFAGGEQLIVEDMAKGQLTGADLLV